MWSQKPAQVFKKENRKKNKNKNKTKTKRKIKTICDKNFF